MVRKVGSPPFRSELLRELERVLTIELRQNLGAALRVAVLAALGYTEPQMRGRLGVDAAELKEAKTLLRRATARLRDEGKGYSEVLREVFGESS